MHDSRERKTSETGAQTDPSHANTAMELLSPYSLWQLASWLGKGAEKYAPRNWEKGIPFSICVGKLQRHLQLYLMGKTDEPHLDAVGFWWHALAHYEAMIKLGKLPASLNDLPQYEKQREDIESEVVGKFTIKKAQDKSKGWYIILTETIKRPWAQFLHKDLGLHSCTGWTGMEAYGCAPGYYNTKEYAKVHITAYENKQKPFVCPIGWEIEKHVPAPDTETGWSVLNSHVNQFLWKDNMLHGNGLGWSTRHNHGEAPGYWLTKEAAEAALAAYLEKESG